MEEDGAFLVRLLSLRLYRFASRSFARLSSATVCSLSGLSAECRILNRILDECISLKGPAATPTLECARVAVGGEWKAGADAERTQPRYRIPGQRSRASVHRSCSSRTWDGRVPGATINLRLAVTMDRWRMSPSMPLASLLL